MKSYRNLFNALGDKAPNVHLQVSIMKQVKQEENRKIKNRFVFSVTLALASLGGIIESVLHLIQSSNQSGFFQYVSLIFSDSSVFFSYWKEFGLSLVESLPLVSTILLLAVVLVFLWSGARALKYSRRTVLTV